MSAEDVICQVDDAVGVVHAASVYNMTVCGKKYVVSDLLDRRAEDGLLVVDMFKRGDTPCPACKAWLLDEFKRTS